MMQEQQEEQRRRAVAWAIALTDGTALAPDQYEQDLLAAYTQGQLTLAQVLHQLDTRVQHILYRSQARYPLTSPQLTDLLEQSRAWNEANHITGLLCYTDSGHFVQLVEGSASAVHALFAKIRLDTRHHHVLLLSDKASSQRWFAKWQMAFTQLASHEFFWLLGYLEANSHNLVKPQIPINDPHLLTLLQRFSQV